MFKNLIVYRLAQPFTTPVDTMEETLSRAPFVDCGATQETSWGWTAPRGEANGAMAESIDGQIVLRFKSESKAIPGEVLARRVAEKAARVEQETGRKPGRKESKELKDEAKMDLLPMAFTKQAATFVWIDREAGTLSIDTSSQSRADVIVSALVGVVEGLGLHLLSTQTSPQAAMAHWLSTQEAPAGFSIDRECELKAQDEEKAVVRYSNHALDIEQVQDHIAQGKMPTKLALTWGGRVSFVLTEGGTLRKLEILDAEIDDKEQGGFDADVAIATGELRLLIPDLIEALGGESEVLATLGQAPF